MKKLHVQKRFVVTVLCTVIITLLLAPIYVSGLYGSLFNNVARVSFFNRSTTSDSFKVVKIKSPAPHKTEYPPLCNSSRGKCVALDFPVTRQWQTYFARVKIIADGKFTVYLRGPLVRNDDGKSYPVPVDYRFAYLNDHQFLNGKKVVEHSKPHAYTFDVKAGDELKFSVEARKHHFMWSDLKEFYAFEPLLFLSVLILAFLFSFKLVQYISKFKIIESNSRIDIVFTVAFILLLFVPMSHISQARKSIQENRLLAEYPKLFNRTLNFEYGKQFETWFNDRFRGRDILLELQHGINFKVQRYVKNNKSIMLPDDTIFSLNDLEQLSRPFAAEKLQKISDNLAKLQDFSRKNNIDLYIIIPPTKEDVWKEQVSSVYHNTSKRNPVSDFVQYIKEHNGIDIIYPRREFMQKHKDYVFYKTDHHWSEFGAFLGYRKLMEAMRKKYANLQILQEGDFNTFYDNRSRKGIYDKNFNRIFIKGSGCGGLGLKENCPLNYGYKYYNHKNRDLAKFKDGPLNWSIHSYYAPGYDKNITILGNSFGGYWVEFLPFTFKRFQMLRVNNFEANVKNDYNMKRFEKHITDFKTDILVLYIPSSYLNSLESLYDD